MPCRVRKTVRKGPAGLDPSAGAQNSKIKPPYSKRNRGGVLSSWQAKQGKAIIFLFTFMIYNPWYICCCCVESPELYPSVMTKERFNDIKNSYNK